MDNFRKHKLQKTLKKMLKTASVIVLLAIPTIGIIEHYLEGETVSAQEDTRIVTETDNPLDYEDIPVSAEK